MDSPLMISLKTMLVSIIIISILGIWFAKIVFEIKNRKLKILLDGILLLPLVLPPTVIGFLLLYVFGVNRVVGRFLLDTFHFKIVFTWWGNILAAVVTTLPLMYRSARAAFESVDMELLHAGRTLGLSERTIFYHILLANCKGGIFSGIILAFARGMGEFGATSMLAGNIEGKTRTLPMAVYLAVTSGNMDLAKNYVLLLIGISFLFVILMNLTMMKYERR